MLAKSWYSIKRKRFKICYLNISCHTINMRETGFLVYIRFVDLSSTIVSKDLFHLQGERLNYSFRTRLTVERKKVRRWTDVAAATMADEPNGHAANDGYGGNQCRTLLRLMEFGACRLLSSRTGWVNDSHWNKRRWHKNCEQIWSA